MRSCWSASPGTNARAYCWARTVSRHRGTRSPAGSRACSTDRRSGAPLRVGSQPACSSALSWLPRRWLRSTLTPAGMKSKVAGKSIGERTAPRLLSRGFRCADRPAAHHRERRVCVGPDRGCRSLRQKQTAGFRSRRIGRRVRRQQARRPYRFVAFWSVGGHYPADAQGRRKVVATSVSGARTTTYINSNDIPAVAAAYAGRARAEAVTARAAAMAAIGVTPQYVAQMRAVGHGLANLDQSEFAEMRAVGVTPEFARELFSAGFQGIDGEDLVQARAVGLTGSYVRAMRSAGVRGDFDDSSSSAPSESIPASRPAPENRGGPSPPTISSSSRAGASPGRRCRPPHREYRRGAETRPTPIRTADGSATN